jgi:hypothetical protein
MRLATRTPVRCSSCFGQKPESPHVDFESSYDGPPIDSSSPRAGHIDWVVMCGECIEAAHSLLPQVRDVVGELRARLADVERERDEIGAYADKLEAAVTDRPARKNFTAPAEKAPKPARKPRYQPETA